MSESQIKNIETIIDQSDKCIKNKLIYPALFMCLTLPDICGKLKYKESPDIKNIKWRYMKWFDEYVNPILNPLDCALDTRGSISFDALACYKLRCSLLHAGEPDIGEDIKIDDFYIDTTTCSVQGTTFMSGMNMVIEDGNWKSVPYLKIRGALVVDCILQAAIKFLKELRDNG